MKKVPKHRKIAIVGTARSGKTVFLTSLINHLFEHHQTEFKIGKGGSVQISKMKAKRVPQKYGEKFSFAQHREALVHDGNWPKKTRDSSHFICNFRRSDCWSIRTSELHFFDFPGERIADVAIGRYPIYEDWSDCVLEHINSSTAYQKLATEYLDTLEQNGPDAKRIIDTYKVALARFCTRYKPMITPSTFLLDQEGKMPESQSGEEFINREAATRYAGLPPQGSGDRQFAPLSENVRRASPDLVKKFARHYQTYRNLVVMPIFDYLKSCKRLIVLIDIPTLLNGGVSTYNDNRQLLGDLFEVLQPESWLRRMFTRYTKLDRVAVVATKSDIVHPVDIENGRLLGLLKQMTDRFTYDLESVEFKEFICSAIVSARPAGNNRNLRGVLEADNPSREEKVFPVSELPEKWPDEWKHGDFHFFGVRPRVPANKAIPPEQNGVDRVFNFIAED